MYESHEFFEADNAGVCLPGKILFDILHIRGQAALPLALILHLLLGQIVAIPGIFAGNSWHETPENNFDLGWQVVQLLM